jgi:arylsulfatase A-like enzyme
MAMPLNILLITADQWRAECLSCRGHPTVRTPALDALAAAGVLFPHHFTQCTPCGPSRASLLTGMYLMNHRSVRNGTPLDARFTNLALELRRHGYDPCLLGYTDTSLDPRHHAAADPALTTFSGVLPGFKQLVPGSEELGVWLADLRRKGYPVGPELEDAYRPGPDPDADGRGPTFAPALYAAEDSDTAFLAERALEFVTEPGRRPWCLHLSILRPHPPFRAPAPYHAMYDPAAVPPFRRAETVEAEARQHPYLALAVEHHRAWEGLDPALHPAEESAMRQLRATYYGLMTEVDHHLGRLFDRLKATSQYDDTLILFTSDHGEQLWDHWLLGKQGYFDQSFHIPLIVKAPGVPGGRIVEAFTENIDLMPTILDFAGAPVPRQCDGRSLRPLLAGEVPADWRSAAHYELDFRDPKDGLAERALGLSSTQCSLAAIRDHRFKYIHFAALPPLLFDLEADPDERQDRAGDPAYADVLRRYAQKMLSWRMAHAAPGLTEFHLGPQGPRRVGVPAEA